MLLNAEEFVLADFCGFVGTWMASQCPHQLHLLSHFGGLDPICPLNTTFSSPTVYPNSPKQNTQTKISLQKTGLHYKKWERGLVYGLTWPLFGTNLPAKTKTGPQGTVQLKLWNFKFLNSFWSFKRYPVTFSHESHLGRCQNQKKEKRNSRTQDSAAPNDAIVVTLTPHSSFFSVEVRKRQGILPGEGEVKNKTKLQSYSQERDKKEWDKGERKVGGEWSWRVKWELIWIGEIS